MSIITYKSLDTGECMELDTELKEGEPTALDIEMSSAYEKGNLYFVILDLSGKTKKEDVVKINANPKYRVHGK